MPGLASEPSNQIGYINPGPLPMPQAQPIGNLFSGFNSGVEAVDSFQKKMSEEITRNDQQKTDLMANEIKRKLAPGQAENALAAQGLQADQIRAAKELQPGAHELALSEQSGALELDRYNKMLADNDPSNDDEANNFFARRAYTKAFGYAPPDKVTVENPNPVPKDQIDAWLEKNYGKEADQVAEQRVKNIAGKDSDQYVTEELAKWDAARKIQRDAAQSAMGGAFMVKGALGTTEDNIDRAKEDIRLRQEYANMDEVRKKAREEQMKKFGSTPKILQEFSQYTTADKTQEFKKGTPEYVAKLQADIKQYIGKQALEAEQLKAVSAITAQRDKAITEQPAADQLAMAKSEADVQAIKNSSKQLEAFEKELSAFEKIDAIKNSGREFKNTDDIAVLYEFVKTLDPSSAVREGEVKLSQSAIPALAGLGYKMEALVTSKNKIVTPEVRRDIFKTIDTLKQGAIQGIRPELQRIERIAVRRNVPVDSVLTEPLLDVLYGKKMTTGKPAAAAPASASAATITPPTAAQVPPPKGKGWQETQDGIIYQWDGVGNWIPKARVGGTVGSASRG